MPIFSSFTINALILVTLESSSIFHPNSLPSKSTGIVLFTSAAVVMTGVEPNFLAISSVSSFAPPKCPDNTEMTKLALSSITIIAGSVFLSFRYGATSLIAAPNEKRHTNPSYSPKSSAILSDVCSSYQIAETVESLNFDGANTFQLGNDFLIVVAIFIPFFVIAKIATFSMLTILHRSIKFLARDIYLVWNHQNQTKLLGSLHFRLNVMIIVCVLLDIWQKKIHQFCF